MQSLDFQGGLRCVEVRAISLFDVFPVRFSVNSVENEQQNNRVYHHDREQAEAPQERHALHEPHQQRRIADWGQASSKVGDQEDEKDHDV